MLTARNYVKDGNNSFSCQTEDQFAVFIVRPPREKTTRGWPNVKTVCSSSETNENSVVSVASYRFGKDSKSGEKKGYS